MSSFKKATKASDLNKPVNEGRMNGVKPWVNGLNLVSSGVRELDDILGGGHVLGSLSLLHEDTYSNHSDTIMMYSIAEAISQQHKTLLIVRDHEEATSIISSLPFNMNKGSLSLDKKNSNSKIMKTLEEEEDDKKRHLKIAWQYGKYIKDPVPSKSSGSGRSSYCSSYDLSNRLQPDVLAENMPRVYCYAEKKERSIFDFNLDLDGRVTPPDPGPIFNGIHDAVHSFLEVHSKTQSNPVRVFIPHYHSILSYCDGAEARAGLLGAQLLLRLKHLMQHEHFPGMAENEVARHESSSKAHIRMTVLASILPSAIPNTCGNSCLQTLNSLADTVLGVESFAGHADAVPIEFRFFCGFFFVHKLHQIAVMAPHRTAACRFGLKRDRRKLHIEPLHLPPEDSRASKYQSETSLGVKQDNKTAATSTRNLGVAQFVTSSHQSAVVGSVSTSAGPRGIPQISIHGNDASRHAPSSISTSAGGTLCASTLPAASIRSTKNLDF